MACSPTATSTRSPADQTACQQSVVPAGTRYVGFFTGTYGRPGPPLRLRLRGARVDVRAPGGYEGAKTLVAIPELRHRTRAHVCLTNLGPAPLALAGVPQGFGFTSTVDGRKVNELPAPRLLRTDELLVGARPRRREPRRAARIRRHRQLAVLVPGRSHVRRRHGRRRAHRTGDHAGELRAGDRVPEAQRRRAQPRPCAGPYPWRVAAARRIRRVPAAAWVCAAIAMANAFTFSVLVPVFQTPDEPEHYAYTEYLVHAGRPPYTQRPRPSSHHRSRPHSRRSTSQTRLTGRVSSAAVDGRGSQGSQSRARRSTRAPGEGGITGESVNPPLYYALEAIPYVIASGGSLLDRVEAMRILSALLFGATVMFVFAFVREALPRPRWAATTAGLAVALQPMAAFIAAAVNNDNLTFTAGAALFWLLARAARRGLDARRGAAIGLALAVGCSPS